MNEIIEIKILDNHLIWMKFHDGVEKVVNFSPFIGKGISKDLQDPDFFNQATIEPGGGISWPNGYDFCPNFLREQKDADQTERKLSA